MKKILVVEGNSDSREMMNLFITKMGYQAIAAKNSRKLFQETEEWFLEKDSDGLFSFEYVCDTLQLHPDYIRQGLLSWKKAKCKERSIEGHRADRKKFVKTRVAHTSVRHSKTA